MRTPWLPTLAVKWAFHKNCFDKLWIWQSRIPQNIMLIRLLSLKYCIVFFLVFMSHFSFLPDYLVFLWNIIGCIRHQCRKRTVLSCRRCLLITGFEKNEQYLNIDYKFDHQRPLSKSKCWYSNNEALSPTRWQYQSQV